MATTSTTIQTGTVVRIGRRNALAISEFRPGSSTCTPGDERNAFLVWFFGTEGPACDGTVTAVHAPEVTVISTLEELSERTLRRIDVGLGRGATYYSGDIRARASALYLRKRHTRLGR